MPATFDDFGLRFLYPDNWKELSRDGDESGRGVTLEMPSGGLFSVTKYDEPQVPQALLDRFASTMKAEYPEGEVESVLPTSSPTDEAMEFCFYYLDLLVVARIIVMSFIEQTIVVQIQAESRDFDAGEPVFAAMLKSIRDGL